MSIGERLKAERKRLGISQAHLAVLTGVCRHTQGNYESDITSPGTAYLTAAADAGINVDWVLTGQPSSRPRPKRPTNHPINLTGLPESVRLALTVIADYLRTPPVTPSPSPDRRDDMIYLAYKRIEMVLSPALAGALAEQLRSPPKASVELQGEWSRENIDISCSNDVVTLVIGPVFFDLTLTEATELADQIDTKMRAAA